MVIGERLRSLRQSKKMSQGDIEKRTGLLRCYLSRVENGHTVPNVETLEKWARALEIPLYRLFYEGENPPKVPSVISRSSADDAAAKGNSKDARYLEQLRKILAKLKPRDVNLLSYVASKMANR